MKVSVIIPIYNVEKYIDRGLTNFQKQTYQDYEIILVDDGSTDGSPALCDAWATRYDRVRVFHKENGGAGSARNLGIENACGEYIYFFDIDDFVDNTLLEYCVRTMDDSNIDMMVFSYRNKDVTTGQEYEIVMDDIRINNNNELRDVYVDQFVAKMNGFPWNKMYRRSFLNSHHMRFEDLLIQQDEAFNLSIYPHVTKMIISSRVLYTYFIYNKGNTRSRFIPNRFEIYKSIYQHFRFLQEHWHLKDQRFEYFLQKRIYGNIHDLLRFNLIHPKSVWTRAEKIAEIDRVLADPVYRDALTAPVNVSRGIEHHLFEWAYRMRSIIAIKILNDGFDIMHRIRRYIR